MSLVDPGLATLLAAIIAGFWLVFQQHRHWKATRLDKVRDAYAEWMGSLLILHRKDEDAFSLFDQMRADADEGRPPGTRLGLTEEQFLQDLTRAKNAQHEAHGREEVAFARITLLDLNQQRLSGAQRVRDLMPNLLANSDGQPPSRQEVEELWERQTEATSIFARTAAKTLWLEGHLQVRWDWAERRREDLEHALARRARDERDRLRAQFEMRESSGQHNANGG